MKKNLFGFTIDRETEGGNNYLVLTKEGLTRNQLIGFQVEMIAHQKIPGLIDLEVRERDAEVKLYYNLKGLVTLSDYLTRPAVNRLKFTAVLDCLLSIILEGGKYFLNDNSFLLEADLIYLDPRSRFVYLPYLPVEISQDLNRALKALVINLVVNTALIGTQDDPDRQILNLLKADDFNLADFRRQLKILRGERDRPAPLLRPAETRQPPLKSGDPDGGNPSGAGPVKNRRLKLRKVVLSVIAAVSVSGAIQANVNNGLQGFWTRLAGSGYFTVGGIMIGLGLTLAVLRFRINRKNSPAAGRSGAECPRPKMVKIMLEKPPVAAASHSGSDETVWLGGTKLPVLKSVCGHETIIVNKDEFVIGRNQELCDYVIPNKSVGRTHARIKNLDGLCFIVDLASKNGTFLNGCRLAVSKQYELNDDDQVTLANLDFFFKLMDAGEIQAGRGGPRPGLPKDRAG